MMDSFSWRSLGVACLVAGLCASRAAAATWDPAAWKAEDTVELRTDVPGEGPHWFPVWIVVIDGQAYVRLGSRAAGRVERSGTKPYLGVRIAGQEFDRVSGVAVPEMAGKVAAAMGEKYWSDIFVRLVPHPLTLRLEPEPVPAVAGPR